MKPDHKPILINVPISLLEQLDEAADCLDLSRSELVRRSLHRDLKFVMKHEVEEVVRAREKAETIYSSWIHCA